MKELSIEEKAKRYDDLLVKLQKAKVDNNVCDDRYCCVIDDIVPELKGSEDEKIRKELIDFVKSRLAGFPDCKRFTDWLEKQGTPAKLSEEEQNRFAKGVLTSCALSFIDYLDAHKYEGKMCVSNGECEDIENAFHNAMWDRLHRYYCKYIEKQGENKPAEEYNITGIHSKHAEGKLGEMIKNMESANKIEPKDYSSIDPHFGKPVDKVEPKFKAGDKIIGTISNIPYYITEVCNGHYLTDVGSIIMFNAQDNFELYEQKPAWSDEDENRLSSVLFLLHEYKNYNFDKWLESLKERVQLQPKQEWSEEDEEEANYIADFIENLIKKEKLVSKKTMIMEEMVDWLKSLRPQKRWKPSDKQMEMVDKIINVLSKMQLFGGRNALIDLKHDLEKLREE